VTDLYCLCIFGAPGSGGVGFYIYKNNNCIKHISYSETKKCTETALISKAGLARMAVLDVTLAQRMLYRQ
jgi:hypothetical protein